MQILSSISTGMIADQTKRGFAQHPVMPSLLRLYPPDVAELWLFARNPHLADRRPIDLLRAGRSREVLDAIAQERAGSFA
jgi:uncharacterized protein (DUF2384 family)